MGFSIEIHLPIQPFFTQEITQEILVTGNQKKKQLCVVSHRNKLYVPNYTIRLYSNQKHIILG